MEQFIYLAQFAVALSVIYVWTFRYHNVVKEFKAFQISDLTRNLVGAAKISLSALLIAGVWFPELVAVTAALMGGFMISAQYFHFKAKNPLKQRLPSFVLLCLCIVIVYFTLN